MLPESTQRRLEQQLDCIPILLRGISPEQLQQRSATGKWSAAENLAHLARYHEVFLERVDRIAAEDRPVFSRYKAEDDPAWPSYAVLAANESMARLLRSRSQLNAHIQQLPAHAFDRTGIHPVFGEMPLLLWIEFFLLHEAHHLLAVLQRVRGG
jgi:hypothetical protein